MFTIYCQKMNMKLKNVLEQYKKATTQDEIRCKFIIAK